MCSSKSTNIKTKRKKRKKYKRTGKRKENLKIFYYPLVAECEMDKNTKSLKVGTCTFSAIEKKLLKAFILYLAE